MPERNSVMSFAAVTIFPEMFEAVVRWGVTGRAYDKGIWSLELFNPRDEAENSRGDIDDRPYGGGAGMVMQAPVLKAAVEKARDCLGEGAQVIALTPQGKPLSSELARELSQTKALMLICGRYEGIDERFLELEADLEISTGDYVVSGGELPAMMLMDSVIRWLPGTLGHRESALGDSFVEGLLGCPQYTRPEIYEGVSVPEVLLSGDHGEIASWRRAKAIERTITRRPDLLDPDEIAAKDIELLKKWNPSSK